MDTLIASADRAEHLASNFCTRIAGLEQQVEARTTDLMDQAEKNGRGKAPVLATLRDAARRESADFRRTLAASSETERNERLKALARMGEEAAALAPMFESPVQLLSRQGLGSPERTNYHAQLQQAGPRELMNYRDWALHTGDRPLAAAILSRLDTLPRDERPFKAVEFAEAMVGDEFNNVRRGIDRINVAVQRALNANRAFERGRIDATARISMGLAQRRTT
jgi:hypothetical protein